VTAGQDCAYQQKQQQPPGVTGRSDAFFRLDD
jgi:hypothetical protein